MLCTYSVHRNCGKVVWADEKCQIDASYTTEESEGKSEHEAVLLQHSLLWRLKVCFVVTGVPLFPQCSFIAYTDLF